MTVYLRIQTPTERVERRLEGLDPDQLGEYAAEWRDQLGFPADWEQDPRWHCAVAAEPVHSDYFGSLSVTQADLRLARGQLASARQELAVAHVQIAEQSATIQTLAGRVRDLEAGRDVMEDLRSAIADLRRLSREDLT